MGYTRKEVEHYARLWIAEVQDAGLLTPVSGVATVHVFGGTLGDPYRIDVEWEGSNEHKYEGSTRFGLSLFGVYDAETAFRIVRSALTTLREVNHVHNYMSESAWYGSVEVYTHNGMGKCWTCGQRLAYWEELTELRDWISEHTHDDGEEED